MQFTPQSTTKEKVRGERRFEIGKRERKTDNVIKCAGRGSTSLNSQQD
jgi:hypothetical protein